MNKSEMDMLHETLSGAARYASPVVRPPMREITIPADDIAHLGRTITPAITPHLPLI